MAAFGGTYAADSTTAQQMSSARMNDDGTYNIAGLKVPDVSK